MTAPADRPGLEPGVGIDSNMTTKQRYKLPADLDVATLTGRLQATAKCRPAKHRKLERVFYDTFDWRLFANGLALEQRCAAADSDSLCLRDLKGRTDDLTTPFARPPRFVEDLPPGALRRKLAPIVAVRALLPVARLRTKEMAIGMLNKDQKTIAFLTIEDNRIVAKKGRARAPSLGFVVIRPVRGYVKAASRVTRRLTEDLGLQAAGADILVYALNTLNLAPLSYSAKPAIALDPSMRAHDATSLIFRNLLGVLTANEEGLLADIDSEFLHDFRVAVRRTRTVLAQTRSLHPEAERKRLQDDLRWLQSVTGPARDIDVYLLKFDGYRALLDPTLKPSLTALRQYLEQEKISRHQLLNRELQSTRYRELLSVWRAFAEDASSPISTIASPPVCEFVGERIWRLYRRVIKTGTAITDASPPEELHYLRKTGKKLRYMLELFESIYPKAEIRHLVRALKKLQDNLGDMNDLQVQSDALQLIGEHMYDRGTAAPQTLMAMGALVDALEQKKHAERKAFRNRFIKFTQQGVDTRFRRLFHDR